MKRGDEYPSILLENQGRGKNRFLHTKKERKATRHLERTSGREAPVDEAFMVSNTSVPSVKVYIPSDVVFRIHDDVVTRQVAVPDSVRRVFKLGPKNGAQELFLDNAVFQSDFRENDTTDSINFALDYPFNVLGCRLPCAELA